MNNIKKVFFLNKEYKKLKQKLQYIKDNKFDLVTTVLLNEHFNAWEMETNTKFITVPFAVDLKNFKLLNVERKFDFLFSGALHENFLTIRTEVKKKIFKKNYLKKLTNQYLIFNPLQPNYKKYSFFWAEWGAKDFLRKEITPTGFKYVKILNQSKICLNTLSAYEIFNPRFFELMATKTLIFCPRSCLKYDILKEDYNCIVFEDDLSNFSEKLNALLSGRINYNGIVEKAFKIAASNTYNNRVDTIINFLTNQKSL